MDKISFIVNTIGYSSLLDIGCGEGIVLSRIEAKGKIVGVDISKKALQIAKNIFPDAKYIVADITDLPFSDKSFDISLCLEVLEHVEDLNKAAKEIKRVSKNTIISVPNSKMFQFLNIIRLKNLSRLGEDADHIHKFNKKNFGIFLSKISKRYRIINSVPWLIGVVEDI